MTMIPYSRQLVSDEDIDAVVEVLRSEWLTTGPKVEEFEAVLTQFSGAKYAVTFSSGTAALHAAMAILDISPNDEVIVSPMTFAATANCILFQGAIPVFSDVDADTLLIDPTKIEKNITSRTRAIITVDYAGQPCDYAALRKICNKHNLILIADACHSLGAENDGVSVGCLADITVLSFHPVKHICTGEGGALLMHDKRNAIMAKKFRNHGINNDHYQRSKLGTWEYDIDSLGFNYRLTDIQCALGIGQLRRLPMWLEYRSEVALKYDAAFSILNGVAPLGKRNNVKHAYHLYVIKIDSRNDNFNRNYVFSMLRERGVGVNVHYKPVFNHSLYQKLFPGIGSNCPVASLVADEILSIPIFHGISAKQIDTVIKEIQTIMQH